MKQVTIVMFCAILLVLTMDRSMTAQSKTEPPKVAWQYSQKRPFNWYYPREYQYYYPQLRAPSGGCRVIYSNGTFLYDCS